MHLYTGTSTWDAFNWYECVCSAKIAAGFFPVDVYRPSIGPRLGRQYYITSYTDHLLYTRCYIKCAV